MAYGHRRYSGTRHDRKVSERVLSRREDGAEIAQQLIEDDTFGDSVHWDEWDDSYGRIWCGREDCACARPPEPVVLPRRKDCRRWCRGKVGRTHRPEWRSWDEAKNSFTPPGRARSRWRVLVCAACGRHLAFDFPWGGTVVVP